jgi:hypothetical protein
MPNVNVFGEGEPVYTGQDGEPIADSPPEAPSVTQDATELTREGLWRKAAGMALGDLWKVLGDEFTDPATGELVSVGVGNIPLVIEITLSGADFCGAKAKQPLVAVQIADGEVRLVAKATANVT